MSEFGELRSLLHGEAGRARWQELCAHLDGWTSGRLEEQALPYAAAALEGWPEACRVAPRRWLERWASGGEIGALSLTRRVEIGRGEAASLEGLLRRGGWDGLSTLTVRTPGELAKELMASGVAGRLRELEVRHETRLGAEGVSALSTRRDLPRLERLVFDACALEEDATTALVRGGGLRSVRELEVREAVWAPVGHATPFLSVEGTITSARSWSLLEGRAGTQARWTLPREPNPVIPARYKAPQRGAPSAKRGGGEGSRAFSTLTKARQPPRKNSLQVRSYPNGRDRPHPLHTQPLTDTPCPVG